MWPLQFSLCLSSDHSSSVTWIKTSKKTELCQRHLGRNQIHFKIFEIKTISCDPSPVLMLPRLSFLSSQGLSLLLVSQITQPIRAKAKPLLLPSLARVVCECVCVALVHMIVSLVSNSTRTHKWQSQLKESLQRPKINKKILVWSMHNFTYRPVWIMNTLRSTCFIFLCELNIFHIL